MSIPLSDWVGLGGVIPAGHFATTPAYGVYAQPQMFGMGGMGQGVDALSRARSELLDVQLKRAQVKDQIAALQSGGATLMRDPTRPGGGPVLAQRMGAGVAGVALAAVAGIWLLSKRG